MNSTRWINVFGRALVYSLLVFAPEAWAGTDSPRAERTSELRTAELAFAQTMASRDVAAFAECLAEDVVFFSGERELRGRTAVVEAWSRFFKGDDAPFSWSPDAVAVSGDLGFTSGPVLDPDGKRIGTFNSVWRRLPDGRWEIVFDRGCPPCQTP